MARGLIVAGIITLDPSGVVPGLARNHQKHLRLSRTIHPRLDP